MNRYSTRIKRIKNVQYKSQHLNSNTRPANFSGHEFTGPMLKSLASGLRSSV